MTAGFVLHQDRLRTRQATAEPDGALNLAERVVQVPRTEPSVIRAAPSRRMATPEAATTNSVFYRFSHREPSAPPPEPLLETEVDEAERRLQMNEQVRRMHEYAARAGKDDPFALTPEAIEEFKKRGDPTIW